MKDKDKDKEKKEQGVLTIAQLDKKYEGKILNPLEGVSGSYSTGIIELDLALGTLGWPFGHLVEIFGEPSTGKSLIALIAIGIAQKLYGKKSAYLDLEYCTPPEWMELHGIDVSGIYRPSPDNAEESLNMLIDLVKTNTLAYVVVDSVVGLVPEAELAGEVGDSHRLAGLAAILTESLKKLTKALYKTSTCVIFINQVRDKFGDGNGMVWGSPIETPGGKALKFYAAQRIQVRKKSGEGCAFKSSGELIGHRLSATVVKNKLAPPQRSAEFDLYYTKGVDNSDQLISLAVKHDIIVQGGGYYTLQPFLYGGDPIKFLGREKLREFLGKEMFLHRYLWEVIVNQFEERRQNVSTSNENVSEGDQLRLSEF